MDISYFLIFCVAPILGLNYLSQRTQIKFIERYKKRINRNEPFYINELNDKYSGRPINFIGDFPKIIVKRYEMMWKDYKDKELNHLARKIGLYFFAMTLVLVLNFIFFGYFIVNS